jgi:polygalacturonase
LNVKDYGATGNGTTNDRTAIVNGISAALSAGKTLYFPSGTYLVGSTITLSSNTRMMGAGDSTIFKMPAMAAGQPRPAPTYVFNLSNKSGIKISDMQFAQYEWEDNIGAFYATGNQNCTIQRIRFTNLRQGFKLGTSASNPAHNWLIEDIVATATWQPMFIADVHESTFNRLTFNTPNDYTATGRPHTIYAEQGNEDLTFNDCVLTEGAGYTLSLYAESSPRPSTRITFNNLTVDATNGRLPIYIGGPGAVWTDVVFNNLTLICPQYISEALIQLSGVGVDVTFNDIDATGNASSYLVDHYSTGPALFDGGTFDGGALIKPGSNMTNLTVQNVTLF